VPPAAFYVALVHHPVLDQTGATVTTALTNLDVHDIARSCRTYGVAGYLIVHPVLAQRELAERIVGHWAEDGRHDFRRQALDLVKVVATLEDAIAWITEKAGQRPSLLITSAKQVEGSIDYREARGLPGPTLMLLGTGFGLAPSVFEGLASGDHVLAPIFGPTDYNHLSVRSACAILLDRLHGIEKTA